MEFYDVINKRRTVRDFIDKEVDEETLKRIIDTGLKAPSNNHLREWEFIVLHTDEEKQNALQFIKNAAATQVEKVKAMAVSPAQKMYAYAMPRQYSMLMNAPYVIIPVFRTNGAIFSASAVNNLNPFASIWCVIENILLASTAEGLACSMRIPVGEEGNNVRATLGIPDDYIIPVYIGLGYPDESTEKLEQCTYSANEKIHTGKW